MKTFKSYIDNNGRLAIPAKIRKTMHLNKGDEVSITYSNSQLVISTFHANIQKSRDILSKYENLNLQNQLITMREDDAKKE